MITTGGDLTLPANYKEILKISSVPKSTLLGNFGVIALNFEDIFSLKVRAFIRISGMAIVPRQLIVGHPSQYASRFVGLGYHVKSQSLHYRTVVKSQRAVRGYHNRDDKVSIRTSRV